MSRVKSRAAAAVVLFLLAAFAVSGCASAGGGGGGGTRWTAWWILPNGGQLNFYSAGSTGRGQFTLDGTDSYSVTSIAPTDPAHYSINIITPSAPTFPYTISPGQQIIVDVTARAGATDAQLRVNLAGTAPVHITLHPVF